MHSSVKLLKISGEDAQEFLQGQLTSDVQKLGDTWQLTGYCNPKGRLLCTGFLWRVDKHFFLLVHAELFESIQARLKMYVMRSKVTIEECATTVHINKSGESVFGKYRGETMTHTLYCANHTIEIEIFENLDAGTKQTGLCLQDLCVNEGLVLISPELTEKYVPQMVNLELVGGVSFKKGCYTGQEIVARMHYLGKLKQRLFRYSITRTSDAQDIDITTGSKLVLARGPNDGNPETTQVASPSTSMADVVCLSQSAGHALVVARVTHAGEELCLADHPSITFAPTTLPYSMD